ncbi:TetR family transcriptional regulator [Amycolatopsis endophytica]|uniref:AcrR family transcriptional regulator n=1 Tax=Amycolatopsis endophytica TaxID=860233 RepID=A0A853B2Y4_9PSEU|nr:TetR/AcrR family transcriptional regulator [Amycolatopsis endophytica]NYI89185.1 AcrR family transcriptional regulator [Amycolatopsis endophytica]
MNEAGGLRERKKQRTREAISNAAIELFFEHGFDQVSIAQIADAAEVSRRTLFAYFPTKEALVVHRFADHETESARVVRGRPDGQAPLDALRDRFFDGLDRRDPITGLNDQPEVLALYRMIYATSSLLARMLEFNHIASAALAEALVETAAVGDVEARMAAAAIVAVLSELAQENHRAVSAGKPADQVFPQAKTAAEEAFALLAGGFGGVGAK